MKKTIGILGGMGPMATADLFQKITALTDAARDSDHIRVYIDRTGPPPFWRAGRTRRPPWRTP